MADDIDIVRELLRSVYVTPRQKDALRRLLGLITRERPRPLVTKVTEGATSTGEVTPSPLWPLLGPGDVP